MIANASASDHRSAGQPIILTAAIDPGDLRPYELLRKTHFPRERNFIPAHLTMFHALPFSAAREILETIRRVVSQAAPMVVNVVGLKLLGSGVAFVIESGDLMQIRLELRHAFEPLLTRQDTQPWSPHITIQNKVARETARQLHADLLADFKQQQLLVEGVDAWGYMDGPWRLIASFRCPAARPSA